MQRLTVSRLWCLILKIDNVMLAEVSENDEEFEFGNFYEIKIGILTWNQKEKIIEKNF